MSPQPLPTVLKVVVIRNECIHNKKPGQNVLCSDCFRALPIQAMGFANKTIELLVGKWGGQIRNRGREWMAWVAGIEEK
jgi:hypothetical protein